MTCKCIETVNKDLREKHNTELVWMMSLGGKPEARVKIEKQIHVKKRGAKAVPLAATYCPFCGTKYGEDEV
jgi:hypothetical protein